MVAKAAKRRTKLQGRQIAAQAPRGSAGTSVAKKPRAPPHEPRTGLEWLYAKGKLSHKQAMAA